MSHSRISNRRLRYPNVHTDNELGEAVQQRGVNIMYIKVYEDKLATLESISLLSRKEHMLPRGRYMYIYVAKECLQA